jgi:hypothetical protein
MISEKHIAKTKASTEIASIHANDWYSFDDVINAWESGRKFHNARVVKQFEKTLRIAQSICEGFVHKLDSDSMVKCNEIHLKLDSLACFTAIYIIPEKVFMSFDKFSELSRLSASYISEKSANSIDCSFLFMPSSKAINIDALKADGFHWQFKKSANG